MRERSLRELPTAHGAPRAHAACPADGVQLAQDAEPVLTLATGKVLELGLAGVQDGLVRRPHKHTAFSGAFLADTRRHNHHPKGQPQGLSSNRLTHRTPRNETVKLRTCRKGAVPHKRVLAALSKSRRNAAHEKAQYLPSLSRLIPFCDMGLALASRANYSPQRRDRTTGGLGG